MSAEFARDAAVTAAIFGFFAAGWFGWAQDDPPPSWRRWLTVGSIVSMLTAIAGGVLAWQRWSDGSAIDAATAPTFGIIVGIEFSTAAILARLRKSDLIPAWIALVVGVHFLPLAPLLQVPLLFVVAVFVSAGALVAIPIARSRTLAVSAATGVIVGPVLLAAALYSLISLFAWGARPRRASLATTRFACWPTSCMDAQRGGAVREGSTSRSAEEEVRDLGVAFLAHCGGGRRLACRTARQG